VADPGGQIQPLPPSKLAMKFGPLGGRKNRPNDSHGRRSLRKSRGDKNRFPLDREIELKIAKNSFTVVIVDKGLCNVSAVRFYQEIMNGHHRS